MKLSGIITGKQIKDLFAGVADEQLVDLFLTNPDGSVGVGIGAIEHSDELGASAAFNIYPPEGYILTTTKDLADLKDKLTRYQGLVNIDSSILAPRR